MEDEAASFCFGQGSELLGACFNFVYEDNQRSFDGKLQMLQL